MIQPRYDAVVLGGGPAGLAAAIALRRQADVSVLVAEGSGAQRERVGESAPPDLLVPLDQLGLSQRFRAAGHAACPGSMSVWGGERVGYNDFILSPMGPAWRLNRRRFDRMLRDAAEELDVTVRWNTRFLQTRPAEVSEGGGHHLLLSLEDGSEAWVRASWVIDATGANAHFARAAGARQLVDDQLLALVRFSNIRAGAMTFQTLLEAVRDGWWYSARLPDDRVITMFVTERDVLLRMRSEGGLAWTRALSATSLIGPTLAGLELDAGAEGRVGGAQQVLPIYSSRLDIPEGVGWSAVGDAASSYDPIAAQGVYKALCDGVAAGRRVASLLRSGRPSIALEAAPAVSRARARFRDYSRNRAHLYSLERRWPESSFWRSRQERAARTLAGLDAPVTSPIPSHPS